MTDREGRIGETGGKVRIIGLKVCRRIKKGKETRVYPKEAERNRRACLGKEKVNKRREGDGGERRGGIWVKRIESVLRSQRSNLIAPSLPVKETTETNVPR